MISDIMNSKQSCFIWVGRKGGGGGGGGGRRTTCSF